MSELNSIKMLVLGGGIYHISLINQLNMLGIDAIVTSFLPEDPALKIARKSLTISTTDLDSLKILIDTENITHIITTASDANTFSQAELNQNFGFNGVLPEQVHAVSHKPELFVLLKKIGLPTPLTVELPSINKQLVERMLEQNEHIIFKPARGSGSNGVFRRIAEYPEDRNGEMYLAQEYIDGKDISGQAIIENGKVIFCAFSEKWAVNGNVPFVHWISDNLKIEIGEETAEQIDKINQSISLVNGTISFDVRLGENGPYIIDYSLRLSGNMLIEAINLAYNVNLFHYHISQVLNQPRFLTSSTPKKQVIAIIFGTAKNEKDLEPLRSQVNRLINSTDSILVHDLVWDNIEESEIFINSRKRIGHAILSCSQKTILEGLVNQIKIILGFE